MVPQPSVHIHYKQTPEALKTGPQMRATVVSDC